ncbi:MAG: ribosome silencing factor [Granulosicoccaceae bacterium]|jgi:ribosome-associated protein
MTEVVNLEVKKLRQVVQDALEDMKAKDIREIDVSGISGFTDIMFIASGTSSRQVKSIANRVVERARENGVRPLGVEGDMTGEWVLIDLGDVVVHVMLPQIRDFYNLEKLWTMQDAEADEAAEQDSPDA